MSSFNACDFGIPHTCRHCPDSGNPHNYVEMSQLTAVESIPKAWGCGLVENFRVLRLILKYFTMSKSEKENCRNNCTIQWRGKEQRLEFCNEMLVWSEFVVGVWVKIGVTNLLIFAPLGFIVEQANLDRGKKIVGFLRYMNRFVRQKELKIFVEGHIPVFLHRELHNLVVVPTLNVFKPSINDEIVVMGASHGAACASIALLKLRMAGYTLLSGFTTGNLQVMSRSGYDWLQAEGVCVLNIINSYSTLSNRLIIDPVITVNLSATNKFAPPLINLIIDTRQQQLEVNQIAKSTFFACGNCLPSWKGWKGPHNAARVLNQDYFKLHLTIKHKIYAQKLGELLQCSHTSK